MKISPVGAEFFHADGKTDKQTEGRTVMMKQIVTFRNSAKAPNKRQTTKLAARCEPAIPSIKRLQTFVLDRTATLNG
jgi:hypothetical protein